MISKNVIKSNLLVHKKNRLKTIVCPILDYRSTENILYIDRTALSDSSWEQNLIVQCAHRIHYSIVEMIWQRDLYAYDNVETNLKQKYDAIGRAGAALWKNIVCFLRRYSTRDYFDYLNDQCHMS